MKIYFEKIEYEYLDISSKEKTDYQIHETKAEFIIRSKGLKLYGKMALSGDRGKKDFESEIYKRLENQ